MVRTQIQLTEIQARALKRMARRQDVSMAELIRRSVDVLISAQAADARDIQWERSTTVIGKYRSGKPDIAREHDRYLDEAYAA